MRTLYTCSPVSLKFLATAPPRWHIPSCVLILEHPPVAAVPSAADVPAFHKYSLWKWVRGCCDYVEMLIDFLFTDCGRLMIAQSINLVRSPKAGQDLLCDQAAFLRPCIVTGAVLCKVHLHVPFFLSVVGSHETEPPTDDKERTNSQGNNLYTMQL